jgi:hypothetical protein
MRKRAGGRHDRHTSGYGRIARGHLVAEHAPTLGEGLEQRMLACGTACSNSGFSERLAISRDGFSHDLLGTFANCAAALLRDRN